MARTLWQLQTLYGQINTTFGIGGESFNGIRKKIRLISKQLGEPAASADQPISHLFIFDRRIDLASILLTGLTYESILNDAFAYNCGKIVFGPDVDQKLSRRQNPSATTISGQTTLTPKTYSLNNADPIFSSIRNSHMTVVFSFLKAKAKLLQSSFDRISAIQNVDEMKKFVANELGSLREQQKQLEIHICACEHLLETMKGFNEKFEVEHAIIRGEYEDSQVFAFLQKMITAKSNCGHVLMLATLWCLRSDGVPSKYYRQLQKAFLHRYGFERMVTFYELRIHGLLYEKEGITSKMSTTIKATKIPFAGNRIAEYKDSDHLNQGTQAGRPSSMFCATLNGFRLFQTAQTRVARKQQSNPETSNVLSPSEAGSSASELETAKGLGFVFSDAYIPLISYLVDRTVTKGWEETILRKVLGEHNVHCSNPQAKAPDNRIRRAILVCFVGGVTYAEIASIRSFAQNRDFRVIILTTHIINREEFLKSFTNIVC